MTCAYCNAPSEYVLHLKLCRIDEDADKDECIEDREADVCLPCGSSIIANETKRAEWHDNI